MAAIDDFTLENCVKAYESFKVVVKEATYKLSDINNVFAFLEAAKAHLEQTPKETKSPSLENTVLLDDLSSWKGIENVLQLEALSRWNAEQADKEALQRKQKACKDNLCGCFVDASGIHHDWKCSCGWCNPKRSVY